MAETNIALNKFMLTLKDMFINHIEISENNYLIQTQLVCSTNWEEIVLPNTKHYILITTTTKEEENH